MVHERNRWRLIKLLISTGVYHKIHLQIVTKLDLSIYLTSLLNSWCSTTNFEMLSACSSLVLDVIFVFSGSQSDCHLTGKGFLILHVNTIKFSVFYFLCLGWDILFTCKPYSSMYQYSTFYFLLYPSPYSVLMHVRCTYQ